MGAMEVADDALYGASTQRAVLNFPISSLRFPPRLISALGLVKLAAAETNLALGLLPGDKASAIADAAREVFSGQWYEQFVVDVFQTGSGTSTNMNANEVIANRAIQFLGGRPGEKTLIHPNDHVNMSQSSNDVIPSVIHIAAALAARETLLPGLESLASALEEKSRQFEQVIKAGRTHLMDATPVTLGQEFGGYAAQLRHGVARIGRALDSVRELALGGTAVGTGVNRPLEFPSMTIERINQLTGEHFREAANHFEAQSAQDGIVELSGQLKTVACSLMKIANDIRWLSSGPRCGLGEIRLPEIQPGSSIMPAKVNPVICESVMMVCAHVIGADSAITIAGQYGNFELNVMLPVIGYHILQSIELLGNAAANFRSKCIDGVEANQEQCLEYAENSLATCTTLAPVIGYDRAAEVAKRALKEDRSVRETAREMQILPEDELEQALDLDAMTRPGVR
jgi:fumarate hydratase, class II